MTCQASGKTAEGFKLVPWLGLLQREDEAQRKVSMERLPEQEERAGPQLLWGCPDMGEGMSQRQQDRTGI